VTDEPSKKLPARIHPDDRSKVAALNEMTALFYGAPEAKGAISYYTPELIQCTLPHSDPKMRDWIRSSGGHTLIVSSGIDKTGEAFGIPYGSFPRLVLAYIITHVVKTGERRIEFKSYFRTFLKEIGYVAKPNVRQAKTLHNSLERLFNATITYEYADGEKRARQQFAIAPKSVLFWNYKTPDQGSLWDSFIEISSDFRSSILDAPIPLRTDMLAALKKSPLAIDLYMWLSYRLFTLQRMGQDSLTLSYGRLQAQFGTNIAESNYRSFRRELRQAFEKVKEHWEALSAADGQQTTVRCEMEEKSLTLYRGPLLVDRREPKKTLTGHETAPVTQAGQGVRAFDAATLRKARQLAPEWDVQRLAQDYFAWLDRKRIAPQNLTAHFLDFVRSHQERNGSPKS